MTLHNHDHIAITANDYIIFFYYFRLIFFHFRLTHLILIQIVHLLIMNNILQ